MGSVFIFSLAIDTDKLRDAINTLILAGYKKIFLPLPASLTSLMQATALVDLRIQGMHLSSDGFIPSLSGEPSQEQMDYIKKLNVQKINPSAMGAYIRYVNKNSCIDTEIKIQKNISALLKLLDLDDEEEEIDITYFDVDDFKLSLNERAEAVFLNAKQHINENENTIVIRYPNHKGAMTQACRDFAKSIDCDDTEYVDLTPFPEPIGNDDDWEKVSDSDKDVNISPRLPFRLFQEYKSKTHKTDEDETASLPESPSDSPS